MRLARAATFWATLALLTFSLTPPSRAEVSFDFFYSRLDPHGSWLASAQFGRVWQPNEYRPGWNPYFDGHWQYTDLGWSWVSDYEWGAIPYHYGTWTLDPVLGWVWVPGLTWAPAWVVFRTGRDAIGWAPVAPGFSVGASIGSAVPPATSFVFVATRDFTAPRIRACIIPGARAHEIYRRTAVVKSLAVENGIVVSRGPDVGIVERATQLSIRPTSIESVARVAPFRGVRRGQLAIAAGHRGRHVFAADPVSAQHPLPPKS